MKTKAFIVSFFCVMHVFADLSLKERHIPAPQKLTVCEGFINPIGFYTNTPRFSWKLPVHKNIISQSAYRILVASSPERILTTPDLWDSEKQDTNQSTWVKYKGKILTSRTKIYWKVCYWDQDGNISKWSKIHTIELGLLKNSDWKAKWIGLDTAKDSVKGVRNFLMHTPQYLRRTFQLPSKIKKARLYITAKGVFSAYINHIPVSNDVMPPGWTPYNTRIETLTYDVTQKLKEGNNAIGVVLAAGWHSGRISRGKSKYNNFESPKVVCQLEITLENGTIQTIITDKFWKGTTKGPIRFADIYDGEIYDANFETKNWQVASYDDSTWNNVNTAPLAPDVKLEPKRHLTVKPVELLDKVELVAANQNTAIYNLKQNIVGVAKVNLPMRKGDTLKIRYSEMLSPDGTFYTANYRSAKSTDYYIAATTGIIEWQPKFTFHGFQYVEISGYDKEKQPKSHWVKGIVQHSNIKQNGTFTSSHQKLNKLQRNITWGLRDNLFDIPTDCPQRDERLGWTGDTQVIAPTAMFNYNTHALWAAWLQSVRETQAEHDDGLVPFIIPDVLQNNKASSGWGDAAVIIPWDIYNITGDVTILEENYDMMLKWLAYHKTQIKNNISHMFSFADWLQPYPTKTGKIGKRGDTPKPLINTAYYAHSAHLVSKIAAVLDKPEDAKTYKALYKTLAQAFQDKFFNTNGTLKVGIPTQTAYLLALHFDLLDTEVKQKAEQQLIKTILKTNKHLNTGFLGTPILPKVLDTMGATNLMYNILFKDTYPSWFYSINQGATTLWERWDSYDAQKGYSPESMNSLNHYAYGAIGQWMYERIAGIAPLTPGYKTIKIAPYPHNPLTQAAATLETPYGKAASAWKLNGDTLYLHITIPPNTKAEVHLPEAQVETTRINGKSFKTFPEVKPIRTKVKTLKFTLLPGTYTIKSKYQYI